MTETFGDRLAEQFSAGRHLCVGIDPHNHLLSDWGLPNTASGAESMGREVVRAAAGVAACVKPQVAFFERFGSAGYTALERVLSDAREARVLVIADVKRGDVGSSFAAYAEAWLSPGSPLEADAMTVHPYQGFGSLEAATEYRSDHGKGLFVLAATSNPEARPVQLSRDDAGVTLAAQIVHEAQRANLSPESGSRGVGSVGVVLGATLNLHDFGIDTGIDTAVATTSLGPILPVLAPGFGFQGAKSEDAASIYGSLTSGLLASESRSVLAGGAHGLRSRVEGRAEAIGHALEGERTQVGRRQHGANS